MLIELFVVRNLIYLMGFLKIEFGHLSKYSFCLIEMPEAIMKLQTLAQMWKNHFEFQIKY